MTHSIKSVTYKIFSWLLILALCMLIALFLDSCSTLSTKDSLKQSFINPPSEAKPGVYWYFMDGNISREEMTKDLESMKIAGISNLIFLEVGIGVPRGPVSFMSNEWQDLFVHSVKEAERLGIKIILGAGPGWCGSGGPWVEPKEAMHHLVFSELNVQGGKIIDIDLPMPKQRSTPWHQMTNPYYEDIVVYAVPRSATPVIANINEKALFERDPYSSKPNVRPFIPSYSAYDEPQENVVVDTNKIVNISSFLQKNGRLVWEAPIGDWTIIRMGKRVTGASSRPAPETAIGLESNKMDTLAFSNHLKNFTDILLSKTAPRKKNAGWTGFHIDSWESGAQNWTDGIVEEFKKRRKYNPEPYLITYTGRAVGSLEKSERFLFDLRQTCKELILENHAQFAKSYAHKNGLELTIEPYDMNPTGDLDLGAVADVIMAEFWSKKFGFPTTFAVIQASSIAHIKGHPIIGSEVFTSLNKEAWQEYPWSMKDQSDWALAQGVNRFVFHTFAHQPLGDEHRPGMTMGPYGVHWDRSQTWWSMVDGYHTYISRSSHLMQQGQVVSDILYLTPEGSPMVFTPPKDALEENGTIPDKKGYGFDACSPSMLMEKATVQNGKIAFEGATEYEIMVIPNFETMTPKLLKKITSLVEQGAKIIGIPPLKSPSLEDYPNCDIAVKENATQLWGSLQTPKNREITKFGKGMIYWGGELHDSIAKNLYPSYKLTASVLSELKIKEDFKSDSNTIRFGHRKTVTKDIYFIANRTNDPQKTQCSFRATGKPSLWISTTGETRDIQNYNVNNGVTSIPMEFYPFESFFVVFSNKEIDDKLITNKSNFPVFKEIAIINGSWNLSFDPKFGGPEQIVFDSLQDWTKHEIRGIKYYSGIATYTKTINFEKKTKGSYYLDLGVVNDIARVYVNGKNMGVVWCAPWRIDVSEALNEGQNELKIEVANRWINRLLGDKQEPDANVRTVKFSNGFLGGKEFKTGRYTFTTKQSMGAFNFKEPLSSGLLGPVRIIQESN